jgi:surface polysaccharide O-acyltransferase-like enzyme
LLATDGLLARRWVAWLAGAFAGFLLWIIPTAASMNTQGATAQALAIVADFAFVLSCALSCFAVLAVFLHFPKHSPVLDSLSQNAYGIYLVHSLFVIWLQYSLLSLPLFAVFKGAIVFTVGLMLSWATSIAICRLPIGARLVGTERRVWAKARGSQAASEHARIEA